MKTLDFFIKKYLENRPMFLSFIRPQEAYLFNYHLQLLKHPHPILDFGCGDGFFASIAFGKNGFTQINNRFSRIIDVGLDLEKSRIDEGKKLNVYKKLLIYNGHKIPFPDNYFATVISNSVLEHIPNLENCLKEIYRVIKPCGHFLATVMTDKWEDYLFGAKIFGNIYKNYMRKKQNHFNLFTMKQWKNEFIRSGFIIEKIIGYISPKNATYLDLFHYLSFPSLVTYNLFKKWQIFPSIFGGKFFVQFIKNKINLPTNTNSSAALFFILKKP